MHVMLNKQYYTRAIVALSLSVITSFACGVSSAVMAETNPSLDKSVMASLGDCQKLSISCLSTTKNAAGVLVFPKVTTADIIVGGAGGKGALIEDGKVTAYYSIGASSAGLQVGVENATHIYVFINDADLAKLKQGPDWKVGAMAGVTLVKDAKAASSANGDVPVYVFDAKGLQAGVSLDLFDIWETGKARPSKL